MKGILKKIATTLVLVGLIIAQSFATINNDDKTIIVNSPKNGRLKIKVSSIISYIEVGTDPDDLWSRIIYKNEGRSFDEVDLLSLDKEGAQDFQVLEISNDFGDIFKKLMEVNVAYEDFFIELDGVESNMGYHKMLINWEYKNAYENRIRLMVEQRKSEMGTAILKLNGYSFMRPELDNNFALKLDYIRENKMELSMENIENIKVFENGKYGKNEIFVEYVSPANKSKTTTSIKSIVINIGKVISLVIIGGGALLGGIGGGMGGGTSGLGGGSTTFLD